MDQEGGRRRSTRLAARGVVPPKAETPAKKTVKSPEKPKRTKRKTAEEEEEEVIDLPDSKKAKSEEPASSDETDKPAENKSAKIEPIEEPKVTPANVDSKENPAAVEEDVSTPDSLKEVENSTAADEKKEMDVTSSVEEEKKPNVQEQEVAAEQPKMDIYPEKSVPVAVENVNGNSDDKNAVEPVKGFAKNDSGFCVAAKDTVTPNGDSDVQMNSANGEKLVIKPETVEPIKVLHDNTNHVGENDLKAVTSPATVNTTSNNDLSGVEQDEKEQDKVVDNAVDVMISSNDNAPSVEQPSTVVS